MASQAGQFNVQEFTDLGDPLIGGRLYTYAYGTTTQKTAFTDPAGAVPHTYTSDGMGGQYIALNARGELPAPLYLGSGPYDLALKTAAGATIWTRRTQGTLVASNIVPVQLASAATVDIGGQGVTSIEVTGNTDIYSFGTNYAGPIFVRFLGSLTLKYNAVTMSIPGGTDAAISPGDIVVASGNLNSNGWNILVLSQTSFAKSGDNNDIERLLALVEVPKGTVSNLPSVSGLYKNLRASATGTNANVSVTADELVLSNSSDQYVVGRNLSLTINTATVGANGLSTGTLAGNTWYAKWVWWNGTTFCATIDTSGTAPTAPSGYTHKARVGWIKTDGTANKYPLSFKQTDRKTQYITAAGTNVTALPLIASGVQGTVGSVLVAASVSSFVPTTAGRLIGVLYNGTASAQVSMNNTSAVAPFPGLLIQGAAGNSGQFDMLLESTNIYYAANAAGASVSALGWEDNL